MSLGDVVRQIGDVLRARRALALVAGAILAAACDAGDLLRAGAGVSGAGGAPETCELDAGCVEPHGGGPGHCVLADGSPNKTTCLPGPAPSPPPP